MRLAIFLFTIIVFFHGHSYAQSSQLDGDKKSEQKNVEADKVKIENSASKPVPKEGSSGMFSFLGLGNSKKKAPRPLPQDFRNSGIQVERVISENNLIYLKDTKGGLKITDGQFVSYIRSDRDICLLKFISMEATQIVASTNECVSVEEIFVGDFVIVASPQVISKWKRAFNTDYISFYFGLGLNSTDVEGEDFSGSASLYGFNFVSTLSENSRIFVDYSVGEKNLSTPTDATGSFVSLSYSQLSYNYLFVDKYTLSFSSFTLMPMVGWYGYLFEEKGNPSLFMAGSGLDFGFHMKSEDLKMSFDFIYGMCLLNCSVSEVSSNSVSSFQIPSMSYLDLKLHAQILPWRNWGAFANLKNVTLSATKAYVNNNQDASRSFSNSVTQLNFGVDYSF
ncbi:MAG: hypothetical protein HOO06_07800 [Bdellovibrionaceae bacterium]|jgi:hypothetical protein|nr:hypothetical protein [Pseudobdellovibrionaceae bacterium]